MSSEKPSAERGAPEAAQPQAPAEAKQPAPANAPLFRNEAIEHHRRAASNADLLSVDETSTGWGFRLLAAALFVSLAFMVIGELTEYATGPAIVRLEGRTMITASQSAIVSEVLVMPGDRVGTGDVLVQFHASDEVSELDAVTREFQEQLRKLLQYPDDVHARESLFSLRTRKELAERRLEQRTVVAPHAGTVGDVRVRKGQLVEAGMSVIDIAKPSSRAHVTALLPGRYRPHLKPGAELRFMLDGFTQKSLKLVVQRVGEEIVGPTEATRYLGRDMADALKLQGPVVLVEASLPSISFEENGERFSYAHGMTGKAESPVRIEPLAYAFVPTLKQWVERVRPGRWFHSRHTEPKARAHEAQARK